MSNCMLNLQFIIHSNLNIYTTFIIFFFFWSRHFRYLSSCESHKVRQRNMVKGPFHFANIFSSNWSWHPYALRDFTMTFLTMSNVVKSSFLLFVIFFFFSSVNVSLVQSFQILSNPFLKNYVTETFKSEINN
jgi:hypothetical protein